MKRMLAVFLTGALALSLAACAGPVQPPASSVPPDGLWSPVDEQGRTKRTGRDAAGENGMVSTSSIYATMASLEVLERGGNAVDAAVAACYALGVAEPFTSGLGGGGFMLIHTAAGGDYCIDYRETAPSGQDAYTWLDETGGLSSPEITRTGALAVGVPGEVAGMEYALANFGSGRLKRQEIMQPAIDLAREGYRVSATMHDAIVDNYQYMTAYPELGAYYLAGNGLPYEVGDVVTNPDLAGTLELIAQGGADAFYTGEVAQAIIDILDRHGGVMTMEDLAGYKVAAREPVTSTYRGYRIISAPPASSGGTHLIEILNILENYDVGAMEVNSAPYVHLLSEAFKAAFADRSAYMADTDFVERVPLAGLTSKEYAKTISDRITGRAQTWTAGDPFDYGHGSTTSLSIADREGNMVTVTQTINYFWGSKLAVPGYGFLLNNEMDDFSPDPASVNCVEGGKRPLSSMTPTVVLDGEGRPFMTVGTPGGTRIFTTIAQVISHVIDHGMDIQQAIDTARVYDNGGGEGICYESDGVTPITAETVSQLEAMGHTLTDMGGWDLYFGGVQGIVYQKDGTLRGGADPRRDGKALAF